MINTTGNIAHKKHNNEDVTITGVSNARCILNYNDKYLFTAVFSPTQLIRFNNIDDLSNQTAIPLNINGLSMACNCLVSTGGYIYAFLSPYTTSVFTATVLKIDPEGMTYSIVINQTMTQAPYYLSGCTDGTNLYILSGSPTSHFMKYRISDWSLLADVANSILGRGYAMTYGDDGYIYVSSFQGTGNNNYVIKLDPSNLSTVDSKTFSSRNQFSASLVQTNGKVFVGCYGNPNPLSTTNMIILDSTNLDSYTEVSFPNVTAAGGCGSIYLNNTYGYVYASIFKDITNYNSVLVVGTNSVSIKMNVIDNTYQYKTIEGNGGQITVSSDNREVYVCTGGSGVNFTPVVSRARGWF